MEFADKHRKKNAHHRGERCFSHAENLPRQHRATVRLHDFIDESLDVFLAVLVLGGIYDVICLDEDLVEGYRPAASGFVRTDGIFKRFCIDAADAPDEKFFFIIDEINRGNLSKIFGELLMLIEKDYRGQAATLPYSGRSFTVPKNLYIIGMMNTADRSLAMIDYALRRRFSFVDMEPGFDTDGFKEYMSSKGSSTMKALVEEVKQLNVDIKEKLGKGFCIGHSYFVFDEPCSDELLKNIVNYDILPMLAEYWFDDEEQYEMWASRLNGVFENGSK